ncbi:hypothetical protein FACS189434_07960 [Bacteroidia bacterium]|nr:hypothetical protein FACS189434_07960 [Bacteroidia bacterium]
MCGDELGGINGVAYISDTLQADLFANDDTMNAEKLTDIIWWETQIQAGLIFVVPSTRGTFDGGAANNVSGFRSDEPEKMVSKTFTAVINDRNHAQNGEFYEALENNARGFYLAWNSGNELRMSRVPIQSFLAQDPVEEDFTSRLQWQATITWIQKKPKTIVPSLTLTEFNDIKELFSNCIDEEEP